MKKVDFDTKVSSLKDWLFGEESTKDVGKRYGLSGSSISNWAREQEILELISEETGVAIEELERKRDRKTPPKYRLEVKVEVVRQYIFGDSSRKKIAEEHDIGFDVISDWVKNPEVLAALAEETGKTIDELKRAHKNKIKQPDFDTKVNAVRDYLFSDLRIGYIENKYGWGHDAIRKWKKDPRVLAKISEETGKTVDELQRMREMKTTRLTYIDTRISAVKDYLIGGLTLKCVRKKYDKSDVSVRIWAKDPDVLARLAEETGKTIDDLVKLRLSRFKPSYKQYRNFDTKVNAVRDYLLDDLSASRVEDIYKLGGERVRFLCRNPEILARVAEESGKTVEELEAIRDKKTTKVSATDERVVAVKDYLFGELGLKLVGKKHQRSSTSVKNWSRNPEILAIVAEETGKTVDELQRMREMKAEGNIDMKVDAVRDYLFSDWSLRRIGKKYDRLYETVSIWSRNPEILARVAEELGKTVEELEAIRDRKLNGDIDMKVDAVRDYLFSDLTQERIGERYKIKHASIYQWLENPEILARVAEETGKTVDELQRMREMKTEGTDILTKVRIVKDYLFSNQSGAIIGKKYGLSGSSVNNWAKDSEVIAGLAEETGMKVEELEAIRNKKSYNGRISTLQSFADLVITEQEARLVVEHFGGNEADIADILAVVYEGRLSRDNALRFLEDPSLRKYLGNFQRPSGIGDIFDAGMHLLPYDKNVVIRDIIYRKVLEYRAERLGPMPTQEQRQKFLQELDREIGALGQ